MCFTEKACRLRDPKQQLPQQTARTPYYIGCASPKKRADFVTLNDNCRSKPPARLII